jgi:hypothetical protein
MPCSFSCLTEYGGPPCARPEILEGVVKSPFVEIIIGDKESQITVGNKSNPPDNKAVIKSFEVGVSDGTAGTVEIYDEEGGSFALFMDKIAKTLSKTSKDYQFKIDFGWIIKDCTNKITMKKASDLLKNKLTYKLMEIASVYDNGRIKFTLTFKDLTDQAADNRAEDIEGTDDQKITLKQAIENILKNTHPKITSVQYLRVEGKGTTEWKFKNEPDGPKKAWHPEQQNVFAAIRKWLTGQKTDRDKGILFGWNPESPVPELILWEDDSPGKGKDKCCDQNIGTFVANGGSCSNVLSFNPSAKWPAALSSGGTPAGAATGGGKKQGHGPNDIRKTEVEKAGPQRIPTVSPSFFDSMSPDEIPKLLQEFDEIQTIASNWAGELGKPIPIEAELRIVGEPHYCSPKIIRGRTVSIILLNPFYIKTFGDKKTWLSMPTCNEVYSNKGWVVMGVNHQISEGSFVTTLKVFLPSPNSSKEPGTPLGCEGPVYENSIPEK